MGQIIKMVLAGIAVLCIAAFVEARFGFRNIGERLNTVVERVAHAPAIGEATPPAALKVSTGTVSDSVVNTDQVSKKASAPTAAQMGNETQLPAEEPADETGFAQDDKTLANVFAIYENAAKKKTAAADPDDNDTPPASGGD